METYELNGLTFSYPGQAENALDGISLTVHRGEFMVLCGPSGCGKSTLLCHLKPVLAPHGVRTGTILFEGRPLDEVPPEEQARHIGFVLQSPDNQLVTDKVWHELAFGLESLGCDTPTIRRRVAEMASFFGIQGWFHRDVADLSGGQKQLLNLASVMVMGPSVLILDEPTSQLDPIAAGELLAALHRINRELGATVILTEHRLEEALPLADRAAVLDGGRLLCVGTPREVGTALKDQGHGMFLAMPTPMRVWGAVESGLSCPVTTRQGQDWLANYAARHPLALLPPEGERRYPAGESIFLNDVWFRYEKDGPDVVKGLSLSVKPGELFALLGGNGTGKTTGLKLAAGLLRPSRGEVRCGGPVGVLPQNPQTLFVKKTVREDLWEMDPGGAGDGAKMAQTVRLCRLEKLLDRHPYDLSSGEQQRLALAKVLLLDPQILLLDEPTKGLDAGFKQTLAAILHTLLRRGVAIFMVSHDVEFCAQYAHRCGLFFDGALVSSAPPRDFFSKNRFYTTAARRMAHQVVPGAVTAEDLIAACGGTEPPIPALETEPPSLRRPSVPPVPGPPPRLPRWRKAVAGVCAAAAAVVLLHFMGWLDLTALLTGMGLVNGARRQLALYAVFAGAWIVMGFALRRAPRPPEEPRPPERRPPPSRRTLVAAALIVLCIPLTLLLGMTRMGEGRYYLVSVLILLECMIPFFLVFEGRRPQARELVVVAVLSAIGVAGRQVFFVLPQFKPVLALTIVAGVALGGETGFLVGAITMLVSNMLFQQGPWTPWQMFATGLVGFLAGVLFRRDRLPRSRIALCVFGAASALVVYGGIMNFQSALTWSQGWNLGIFLSYYVSGFPMDCVHAAATWIFLWFAGEPMLEGLDRLKGKYGLAQRR